MHTEVREPLILGGTGLKATLRPGSRKPSSSKQISRGLVLRLLCQGRTKGHGPWNDHPRNDLVNKMEVKKYLCKRLLATTCKQCVFTCDSACGRADELRYRRGQSRLPGPLRRASLRPRGRRLWPGAARGLLAPAPRGRAVWSACRTATLSMSWGGLSGSAWHTELCWAGLRNADEGPGTRTLL